MFKLKNGRLDAASLAKLAAFQSAVDQETGYTGRVAAARTQWDLKRRDPVFSRVRNKLIDICQTGSYCHYCCWSEAGHIDHFRPKNLYPELTFAWSNFLHSCERCNTKHKKDLFAIIVDGYPACRIEIVRQTSVAPPTRGVPALINPRREDPLNLLRLDIAGGTFYFLPIHADDTIRGLRARYTCDLLALNRSDLVKQRRGQYNSMVRYLHSYHAARLRSNRPEMRRMRELIRDMSHQAVWQEMVRSRQAILEVGAILSECPELHQNDL